MALRWPDLYPAPLPIEEQFRLKDEFDAMPVRLVTRAELVDVYCRESFIPAALYTELIAPLPNEHGIDMATKRRIVLLD